MAPVDAAPSHDLFEASADALLLVDARGVIVAANPAAEAMLGWARDELAGQPLTQVVPARAHAAHVHHLAAFFAAPQRRPLGRGPLITAVRKDGRELDVDISLSPLATPDGVCAVAALRDATADVAAQRRLAAVEALTRALFEESPDAMFVDVGGRFVDVNRAACALVGVGRDALLGKSIADLIPFEDLPRLVETRARIADPAEHERGEWTLLRGDGARVPVEVSARVLPDGRWVGVLRDVSARRRAEEALRASEAALRRSQEIAGVGTWERDLVHGTVEVSPQLRRMLGLPAGATGEVPMASWRAATPNLARAREQADYEGALRAGGGFRFEHDYRMPDGSGRIFLEQGRVLVADGVPVRVVGTTLDVTELRAAERERSRALRELEAVLEQAPVGISITRTPDARVVERNRAAREIAGDPAMPGRGQLLRVDALTTLAGEPVAAADTPIQRALRGEHVRRAEYLVHAPDGGSRPVEVSASPVLDDDGRVEGAVLISQDISANLELERLRAEWSAVVAHDLRQPLNSMRLYAELLGRRATLDDASRRHLTALVHMIVRLGRMTDDLLDLSRLDARRLTLDRRPLDVAACVRDTCEQVGLGAPERAIELAIADGVPAIRGDADRLAQVLENLLSNALKYGAPETPVRVSLAPVHGVDGVDGGRAVELAVANEGEPIPAADLARVFQRFERAGIAGHRGVPGIGLGLQIAQALVEAHGGHITVDSGAGRPTVFRVVLPAE